MTVRELMEKLSHQPLDAVVITPDAPGARMREIGSVNFAWARQETRRKTWWQVVFSKTDDSVKTAVVIE